MSDCKKKSTIWSNISQKNRKCISENLSTSFNALKGNGESVMKNTQFLEYAEVKVINNQANQKNVPREFNYMFAALGIVERLTFIRRSNKESKK